MRKNSIESTNTTTKPSKKPAVSKIASLWRKDDKPKNAEKKVKERKEKKEDKPAKGLRKVFRASGRQSSKEEKVPPARIIRSSTYDKIDLLQADTDETTEDEMAKLKQKLPSDVMGPPDIMGPPDVMAPPPTDGKKMWRRTYTIDNDGLEIQTAGAWQAEEPVEKPKKSGISLWRRKSSAKQSSDTSKKGQEVQKKGLWRRKSSKPTSPQDPGEFVSAEGSGVWQVRSQDSIEQSEPLAKPPPLSPTQSTSTNAAIVAPFNYKPTPSKASTLPANMTLPSEGSSIEKSSGLATSLTSLDGTPMTKTEMLMARRRKSYLTKSNYSVSQDDDFNSNNSNNSCVQTRV